MNFNDLSKVYKVYNLKYNKIDDNSLTLYEISNVYRDTYLDYLHLFTSYNIKLNNKLRQINKRFSLFLYDFNYSTKEIILTFGMNVKPYESNLKFGKIYVSMNDKNDLIISDSDNVYDYYVINVLNTELKQLYNEFMYYDKFFNDSKIYSYNYNNYTIWFNNGFIRLFTYDRNIDIRYNYIENKYYNMSKSAEVKELYKGHEELVFKSIFLNVNKDEKIKSRIKSQINKF